MKQFKVTYAGDTSEIVDASFMKTAYGWIEFFIEEPMSKGVFAPVLIAAMPSDIVVSAREIRDPLDEEKGNGEITQNNLAKPTID